MFVAEKPKTVCAICEHAKFIDGPEKDVMCGALQQAPGFSSVTGRKATRPSWRFCAKVNNGNCPDFKPKDS